MFLKELNTQFKEGHRRGKTIQSDRFGSRRTVWIWKAIAFVFKRRGT